MILQLIQVIVHDFNTLLIQEKVPSLDVLRLTDTNISRGGVLLENQSLLSISYSLPLIYAAQSSCSCTARTVCSHSRLINGLRRCRSSMQRVKNVIQTIMASHGGDESDLMNTAGGLVLLTFARCRKKYAKETWVNLQFRARAPNVEYLSEFCTFVSCAKVKGHVKCQ